MFLMLCNEHRKLVLDNIELINFCKKIGVDFDILNKCRVDRLDNSYVILLNKDRYKPYDGNGVILDGEFSIPDIVLIMIYNEQNDSFDFETTDFTYRILKK